MTTVAVYRKYKDDGAPWKDWSWNRDNVGGITVYFGTSKTKQQSRLLGNLDDQEMQKRITEKVVKEGYTYLGEFPISDSGFIAESALSPVSTTLSDLYLITSLSEEDLKQSINAHGQSIAAPQDLIDQIQVAKFTVQTTDKNSMIQLSLSGSFDLLCLGLSYVNRFKDCAPGASLLLRKSDGTSLDSKTENLLAYLKLHSDYSDAKLVRYELKSVPLSFTLNSLLKRNSAAF